VTGQDLESMLGVLQTLQAKVEELARQLDGSNHSNEIDSTVYLEGLSLSQKLFGEAKPLLYLRWAEPYLFQVHVDQMALADLIGRVRWSRMI